MTEKAPRNYSRRDALRLIAGGIIGYQLTPIIGAEIDRAVENYTDYNAGNAGVEQFVDKHCKGAKNPEDCIEEVSIRLGYTAVFQAPLIEEGIFRAVPSAVTSISEGKGAEASLREVINGTEIQAEMTRREMLVGVISSILFARIHNRLPNGEIADDYIPAGHASVGFVLWVLQRKLGFMSNTIAHSAHNYRVLTSR